MHDAHSLNARLFLTIFFCHWYIIIYIICDVCMCVLVCVCIHVCKPSLILMMRKIITKIGAILYTCLVGMSHNTITVYIYICTHV